MSDLLAGERFRVDRPGPRHAGEILTVQRAAYVTEAQRYRAPDIPPLVETLAELRADLARADDHGLVARAAWLGPRVVGSVRGRVTGSRMEIARFAVAPDVQGAGIGRALLAAVHAAAPAPVTTCWLVTGRAATTTGGSMRRPGTASSTRSPTPRASGSCGWNGRRRRADDRRPAA
jgi:GNAT superfamily N-acetyltransferase